MKHITLTFDNGPTPEVTPFVLEELQRRSLPAYFCLVGSQLKRGQEQVDIAKQAQQQGHLLVNHSLSHSTALGDQPGLEHATQEIAEMDRFMQRLFGRIEPRWFRPFGRGGQLGPHLFSVDAISTLASLDYNILLWNSIPRDWEDTECWVATALQHVDACDHTVVVLHDLNTGAMKHLPLFLDTLQEAGHTITLDLPGDCTPTLQETQAQGLVSV